MKKLLVLSIAAFSITTMAIEFITEAQVGERLGAQKVIAVSKYSVETLMDSGSKCEQAFASRSARAYVVKKGNDAFLYLTEEGLKDLSLCKEL